MKEKYLDLLILILDFKIRSQLGLEQENSHVIQRGSHECSLKPIKTWIKMNRIKILIVVVV